MIFGLLNALGDFNLTMECVSPLIFAIFCAAICLDSINFSKKLSVLIEKIEKDWTTWSTESEIEILKKHARDGKNFRMIYYGNKSLNSNTIYKLYVPSILI
ncbi:uncharacterized protein LOC122502508 [Leptopilina heterotoma]|uniref:uncharacterized protein LOC122502508 n=1 Tax=Leptopilina heterotoma TaxID=63436 RepID=UPI001CA8F027|nr:uncharacterized protein LOC122502508 [Leptopilina heterotoma]